MIKRLFIALLLACAPAFAQVQSGGVSLAPGAGFFQAYTAGGTISAGDLVVLNASNQVVDVTAGATHGVVGIAQSNAISSQLVNIAFVGEQKVNVDSTCSQGFYVVISSSTNGQGSCQSGVPTSQEIGISFSSASGGQITALVTLSSAISSGGSGTVSGQVSNQIGYATSSTVMGGTIPCNVTGYIMAGINASPPACNPTGAVGPQITTTPYTVQCDTTGSTVDRGTTLKFMSGSGTLVVDRPGDSGCQSFHFAVEVEISSLTVNREAGASYTFTIHNGSTTTTGATTLTLTNGQWAFFKQDNYGCSPESSCIWDVDEVPAAGATSFSGLSGSATCAQLPALTGNVTTSAGSCATTIANAAVATAMLAANAVTSAKMAVVNTRRTCDIAVGDTSGSAITNAQLGPQKRICYIPAAATIVEMDVAADGGTPNVIVAVDHAGTNSNIVSAALATAASGGIACSNTGGTTGIDGATTCTNTLQNTSIAAGDYLELVSGTAGGTAKLMTIHVIYTVN